MTDHKHKPGDIPPGDSLEANDHSSPSSAYTLNDVYISTMPPRLIPPPSLPGQFPALFECYVPPAPAQLPFFLQQVSIRALLDRNVYSSGWRYTDRHTAQNVLPYLYLGPWSVAKDALFLRKNKVTMIIAVTRGDSNEEQQPTEIQVEDESIRRSLPRYLIETKSIQGLSVKVLSVASNAHLTSRRLIGTAELINSHMATMNPYPDYPTRENDINGCVLVCSEGGNVRAAALVIAYLMKTFAASLPLAHRLALDARSSISFDAVLTNLLWSFHETLQAEAAVFNYSLAQTTARATMPLRNDPKRKRLDDDGGEDDEGGYYPDKELGDESARSRNFAPFDG